MPYYDDDESPLSAFGLDLPSLAPLAPLTPGQAAIPPHLRKQLEVGEALMGRAEDLPGALTGAQEEKKRALGRKIEAIERATARLTALDPSGPGTVNLPLLAAASGFLAPTRTGSFGESLSQASRAALPALTEARKLESDRQAKFSELDIAKAAADEATADLSYKDLLTRIGLGQKISASASTAEARRQQALMRAAAQGRPQFKVVSGVGLVRIQPDGGHEVVVASRDPATDPKTYLAAMRLVQNITKDYEFSSPTERTEYENKLVQSFVNSGMPIDPVAIRSDIAKKQPKLSPAASPAGKEGAAMAPAEGSAAAVVPPPSPQVPSATSEIAAPATPAEPRRITEYEKAAGKKEGEIDAKLASEEASAARTSADAALSVIGTIDGVRAINAPTGRLGPAKQALGSWAEALGLPMPKTIAAANDLTAFNAIATNVVLSKQMEQKGVQTESDAQRMRETFAGIKNPMEANELIMRFSAAQAKRSIDMSRFMEDYKASKGTYIGAKSAWQKHITEVPMVRLVKGKPMFFHEFRDRARAIPENKNIPDIDAKIIEDWVSRKDN